MRRITLCAVLALLVYMTAAAQDKQVQLKIALKHDNDVGEAQTKSQLQRLLTQYDCSKFVFTKDVVIDRDAIPHSHPVLTLHTRHRKDDELLLSVFVHEQIHWFFTQHAEQTAQAVKELRTVFPKVPIGFPAGARNEDSAYLHLLVNTLEYRALKELLAELKARQVWSSGRRTITRGYIAKYLMRATRSGVF